MKPSSPTTPLPLAAAADDRRALLGWWLGLLGVTAFAITLPATRLATGTLDAPQLTPWFVTVGRAALAGVLSALFLAVTRSPLPARKHWLPLGGAVLGNLVGYPLLLGMALRSVTSNHAAVVTALLPLATAVVAAVLLRQRARPLFWLWSLVGCALVVVFMLWQGQQAGHGFALEPADGLLFGAVALAALGYVCGAKVTPDLGAERVICWMCLLALPATLPATWWLWPAQPVNASAWGGFVYVGVFSMWAGFFAWYRGLDWGGALRVSQVQLLQPFISMAAAWLILGESLEWPALAFAAAVVATVFLGRKAAR